MIIKKISFFPKILNPFQPSDTGALKPSDDVIVNFAPNGEETVDPSETPKPKPQYQIDVVVATALKIIDQCIRDEVKSIRKLITFLAELGRLSLTRLFL